MKHPKGSPRYECAPPEFRRTPMITGSFELDSVIHRNKNRDIPSRIATHVEKANAYGAKTGYDGYHGYSGDD